MAWTLPSLTSSRRRCHPQCSLMARTPPPISLSAILLTCMFLRRAHECGPLWTRANVSRGLPICEKQHCCIKKVRHCAAGQNPTTEVLLTKSGSGVTKRPAEAEAVADGQSTKRQRSDGSSTPAAVPAAAVGNSSGSLEQQPHSATATSETKPSIVAASGNQSANVQPATTLGAAAPVQATNAMAADAAAAQAAYDAPPAQSAATAAAVTTAAEPVLHVTNLKTNGAQGLEALSQSATTADTLGASVCA